MNNYELKKARNLLCMTDKPDKRNQWATETAAGEKS